MVTKYRELEAGSGGMLIPLSQSKAGLHCNPEAGYKAIQVWKPSRNKQTNKQCWHRSIRCLETIWLAQQNHICFQWFLNLFFPLFEILGTKPRTSGMLRKYASTEHISSPHSVNCKMRLDAFFVLASYLWASSAMSHLQHDYHFLHRGPWAQRWGCSSDTASVTKCVSAQSLVAISGEVQVYSGFR